MDQKNEHYEIILKAINEAKNIAVFHHIRPDGDCLGAQAGLVDFIKSNWSNKNVFAIGDNEDNFDFLNWSFQNINDFKYDDSLAIVVDVSDPERVELSEFFLNSKFKKRARIDHHIVGESDLYDYSWVDSNASAACEMVAELTSYYERKYLPTWVRSLSNDGAEKLYLGLTTDSNRYLYSGDRRETLDVGSWLLTFDFDVKKLYEMLYKKDLKGTKFSGHVLNNFKQFGNVLYFVVSQKLMDEFNYTPNQVAVFNNLLANIEDNHVWVYFIENNDNNNWRVRIRSNGPAINKIAEKFNGGGHAMASGATIYDFEKEQKSLLYELNDAVQKYIFEQKNKA